jgi:hypothetical protein
MNILKATPIFVVDSIPAACLSFWEKTGWKKIVEVPHEGEVGFVLLGNGDRELMLQTRASVKADLAAVDFVPTSGLYVDVESVAEARAEAEKSGAVVLIRERTTAYGARESWVRAPGGVLVGYAEPKG